MVFHIKTTLNIDDTVMDQLRRESVRQGKTMSELVESALRLLFRTTIRKAKPKLQPLPAFRSGGHLVDIADRGAVYDVMEGRRQVFVVDTNVLIYAADPDSELHRPCRRSLEDWRAQAAPWYLSWNICYEFLRLCTHPRIFRRPWTLAQGWRFLESLFESPSAGILLPTTRHLVLLNEVLAELPHLRGNILHDLQTAVLMREHGIRQIYTRDSDFHRFPFLTVIDPAA